MPHAGCGVVYELAKGSGGQWTQTVLSTFQGNTAGEPSSPILGGFDSGGNLYGSSWTGGAGGCNQCGSVFQLTPSGNGTWKQTFIWSFTYPGIYYPNGVAVTPAGKVFGTTETPGGFDYTQGSLFELTPSSSGTWQMSLDYVFPFTDGQWPSPGLVADAAGNLYGTSQYGGTSNLGMVFELSPTATGWKQSTLYNFNGAAGGTYASAGASPLTPDGKGNVRDDYVWRSQ